MLLLFTVKSQKKNKVLTRQILGTSGRGGGELKNHSHAVELQKAVKTNGKVAVDCFYPDCKAARVPLLKTHWSTPVLQNAHWIVLTARRPLVKFSHLQWGGVQRCRRPVRRCRRPHQVTNPPMGLPEEKWLSAVCRRLGHLGCHPHQCDNIKGTLAAPLIAPWGCVHGCAWGPYPCSVNRP